MASEEESRGQENLGQDSFVEKLRPNPSDPPPPVRVLEGLLGDSDREGYRRLYFTRELDHYAEFRQADIVHSEKIPPDQHPFVGLDATRVTIRRDATVEFTRTETPRPLSEFDLDVRLGDPRHQRPSVGVLGLTEITCHHSCGGTCYTCGTCPHTACGGTCHHSCGGTCLTCDFRCA
jgi:hypothetical protein